MKKLTVAGIGAGNYEGLTVAAARALEKADVIVGYTVYCELMKPYFPDKTWISTPMMKEIERCRLALETAEEGKRTVMICSGDAGIYGMASPVLELAEEYGAEVEILAGVTAASSGAALLGSPLTADFAAISLSDLLTPWETVEKRLEAAASGDLVTVLYNPASRKRADYLRRACAVFLRCRPAETVCGVARNVGREGESAEILTLGELAEYAADMFTTVFIGNGSTRIVGGKMVTPRGYRHA